MIAFIVKVTLALFLAIASLADLVLPPPSCNSRVYTASGELVCVDPCTAETVSFAKGGNPVCLLLGNGEICPRESIAFKDEDPVCLTSDDGQPCAPDEIFFIKGEPTCLPLGSPECVTVAFFDEKPQCQPCIAQNVFYDNEFTPICLDVGGQGCLTVRYNEGTPKCYDCKNENIYFDSNTNTHICLPIGDPDCLSIGWFDGTPQCLPCATEDIMYTAGNPSC